MLKCHGSSHSGWIILSLGRKAHLKRFINGRLFVLILEYTTDTDLTLLWNYEIPSKTGEVRYCQSLCHSSHCHCSLSQCYVASFHLWYFLRSIRVWQCVLKYWNINSRRYEESGGRGVSRWAQCICPLLGFWKGEADSSLLITLINTKPHHWVLSPHYSFNIFNFTLCRVNSYVYVGCKCKTLFWSLPLLPETISVQKWETVRIPSGQEWFDWPHNCFHCKWNL